MPASDTVAMMITVQ